MGAGRISHTGVQGDDYEGRAGRIVIDKTGCPWRGGGRVGSWHAGYKKTGRLSWRRPSEASCSEDKVCWIPTFGTCRRWPRRVDSAPTSGTQSLALAKQPASPTFLRA